MASPRDAVLTTTELLEHILIHLPASQIVKIGRVNRYWLEVVTGSSKIREASIVSPVLGLVLADNQLHFAETLRYRETLRLNPTLKKFRSSGRDPCIDSFVRVSIKPGVWAELLKHAGEQVASPPCLAISIELWHHHCTVFARSAVTIMDVYKAYERLQESTRIEVAPSTSGLSACEAPSDSWVTNITLDLTFVHSWNPPAPRVGKIPSSTEAQPAPPRKV